MTTFLSRLYCLNWQMLSVYSGHYFFALLLLKIKIELSCQLFASICCREFLFVTKPVIPPCFVLNLCRVL